MLILRHVEQCDAGVSVLRGTQVDRRNHDLIQTRWLAASARLPQV
jgi:hypothetical protein